MKVLIQHAFGMSMSHTGTVLDQPAGRALLDLVWDGGGDVLAVVVGDDAKQGRTP